VRIYRSRFSTSPTSRLLIYALHSLANLTDTGDTIRTMEGIDRILITYEGLLDGFPPTYLVTGTRDMLLSNFARVHRQRRQSGIAAELNVYEGSSHGEYLAVSDSPESRQHHADLSEFLTSHPND
jgi:monoterpene epsilon-lactone hydrolase